MKRRLISAGIILILAAEMILGSITAYGNQLTLPQNPVGTIVPSQSSVYNPLNDPIKKALEEEAIKKALTKLPNTTQTPRNFKKVASVSANNSNIQSESLNITDLQKANRRNDKKEIIVKYKDVNKRENTKEKISTKKTKLSFKSKQWSKKFKIETIEISDETQLVDIINELKKDPNVEYAQPNYKLELMSEPSDERFSEQWSLQNSGQTVNGQASIAGVDINVINAWNITKGSDTVKVAIIDTGVDIRHPDLAASIYKNSNEQANGSDDDENGYINDYNGWNFVDDSNNVFNSEAEDTHGTHIAGIIAAGINNGGVVGVSPNVKIVPLKFISGNTGYTSDAIRAIEYCQTVGVSIANLSWGGADYNEGLKDVMEKSGITFICAAGNAGKNIDFSSVYPAAFNLPNIIVVSANDSKGQLAAFSNYGTKVDVSAPGVNILSTLPGNKYGYMNGTSMAAPFVTGTAALLKSINNGLSATEIKELILNNVTKSASLSEKVSTSGRLNAYAALINSVPEYESTPLPTGTPTPQMPTEKSKEPQSIYDGSLASNGKIEKPLKEETNLFIDSLINKGTSSTSSENGIENLSINKLKGNFVTVTWTTDVESDSILLYGTDSSLVNKLSYPELTTKHQITLRPDSIQSIGFYKVCSNSKDGRVFESGVKEAKSINDLGGEYVRPLAVTETVYSSAVQEISTFSYVMDNGSNQSLVTSQPIGECTVFGTINGTRHDFYSVNLTAGKTYTIKLTGMATGEDYDIYLMNDVLNDVGYSTNISNYDESISYTATATATYYIDIQPGTYNTNSAHHNYQLMFYSTENNPDSFEPNDSKETAYALGNDTLITPTININTDEDWFVLDTTRTGKLAVTMKSIPSGCDYDIQVYDASGILLGGSYSGDNKDEKFDSIITIPGKYYVRVYSYTGSNPTDTYEIKASVYTPDQYEVNDDIFGIISESKPMAILNSWINGTIDNLDDVDCYKFSLANSTKVWIDLKNIPSETDYDIVIYSYKTTSGFTEIGRSTNGSNLDEAVMMQLNAGLYYIKVYSYSGNSESNNYKLGIRDRELGTVRMDFDKVSAVEGDIITATISVDNMINFAGYQINIKYDPAVVQPIDDSLQPYSESTRPTSGNMFINSKYSPTGIAANQLSKGILNFGATYLNLAAYKQSNVSEESGTLAIVKFKVLKNNQIQLRFEDSEKDQGDISGVSVYDWYGNLEQTGFVVQQPQIINSNMPVNPQEVKSSSVENNCYSLSTDIMYKFSGYISTDLISTDPYVKANFRVTIYQITPEGNQRIKHVYTDASGFFEIIYKPTLTGNYTIEVTKQNYLKRVLSNTSVVLGTDISDICFGTFDNPVMMHVGDVITDITKLSSSTVFPEYLMDDAINMADVIAIAKYFNTTLNDNKYNHNYDFNKDNAINMTEVVNIAKRFNKVPEDYPIVTPTLSKSIFYQEDHVDYYNLAYFNIEVGKDIQGKMDYENDDDFFKFITPSDGMYKFDFYANYGMCYGSTIIKDGSTYIIKASNGRYSILDLKKDQQVIPFIGHAEGTVYTPDTYRVRVSKLNPDLMIKSIEPGYAITNQPVQFKVVVKNIGEVGTKPGQSFKVSLNIDGTQIIYTENYSTPIPSQGEATLTFTLPISTSTFSQLGMHTLVASVDYLNSITEVDELNNCSSRYFYVEDHGNSIDNATQIEIDKDIIGKIDYASFENNYYQDYIKSWDIPTNYPEDKDFFKFTVPVDGIYKIYTIGNTDTRGELFDGTTRLQNDYGSGSAGNFLISENLLANKVYYITVKCNNPMNTGEYTLRIDSKVPDLIVTDIKCANPVQGKPAVLSATVKNIGDLASNGNFRVGFEVGNSGIILWTDNYNKPLGPGQEDKFTVSGGTNGASIIFNEKGSHFVTAYVDDLKCIIESNENNNYLTRTINIDDHGNNLNEASVAELGKDVLGWIDYPDDKDWFSFTPQSEDEYKLSISSISGGSYRFDIYDQTGKYIDGKLPNKRITLNANTTYYILVYAYGLSGNYKLQLTKTQSDLIVTDISPSEVKLNTQITFSAIVRNIGQGSVIASKKFKVGFSLDGQNIIAWSDCFNDSLNPGSTVTVYASAGVNGPTLSFNNTGTYHVWAFVDYLNTVDNEINKSNNTFDKDIFAGYADLAVADIVTNGDFFINKPVGYSIVVKNLGQEATKEGIPFRVGLTFELNGQTNTYYTSEYSSSIQPDQSVTLGVFGANNESIVLGSLGKYKVTASIINTDALDNLKSDNDNLYKYLEFIEARPYFAVTDITYSPADIVKGDKVTFSAKVKNVGNVSMQERKLLCVRFKVDGNYITNTNYFSSSLEAGQTIKLTGTWKWDAAVGQHKITAEVYYNNTLELNTSYSETLYVGDECDLKIDNIVLSPANPIVGDKVTLNARIKNIGNGASPAGRTHRVGFKINDGPILNWSESHKWSIESGGYATISATQGVYGADWIPTTQGIYNITAVFDDTGLITESGESNNSFTKSFTVTQSYEFNPDDDYDGDGLPNKYEISMSTDVFNYDTDGDGISDFDEVNLLKGYCTNPSSNDTDGDGIYDLAEIRLSKSPVDKDENPLVTREVSSNNGDVVININGDSNLSVYPIKVFQSDKILLKSINGIVGFPVEVSLGGYQMKNDASITMKYNEAELGNTSEDDLTIYWVDYHNKKLIPVSQDKITIDKANNKITGIVSHFSTYIVGPRGLSDFIGSEDIAFSIDESGSMKESDPNKCRRSVVSKFVSEMDIENVRAGIVSFSSNATILSNLTNESSMLQQTLDNMGLPGGNTNIYKALEEAANIVKYSNNNKFIILLSDGDDTYGNDGSILDLSRELSINKIRVVTVALGSGANVDLLTKIASITNGECFTINSNGTLSKDQLEDEIYSVYSKIFDIISVNGEYSNGDYSGGGYPNNTQDPQGSGQSNKPILTITGNFYVGEKINITAECTNAKSMKISVLKPGGAVSDIFAPTDNILTYDENLSFKGYYMITASADYETYATSRETTKIIHADVISETGNNDELSNVFNNPELWLTNKTIILDLIKFKEYLRIFGGVSYWLLNVEKKDLIHKGLRTSSNLMTDIDFINRLDAIRTLYGYSSNKTPDYIDDKLVEFIIQEELKAQAAETWKLRVPVYLNSIKDKLQKASGQFIDYISLTKEERKAIQYSLGLYQNGEIDEPTTRALDAVHVINKIEYIDNHIWAITPAVIDGIIKRYYEKTQFQSQHETLSAISDFMGKYQIGELFYGFVVGWASSRILMGAALDKAVAEANKEILNIINRITSNLRNRIASESGFILSYSEKEISEIVITGSKLGLDEKCIEDFMFVGSRIEKSIVANELMVQMDNFVNVILKRGFPYRFENMQKFTDFKTSLSNLVEKYGITTQDIRIQGSCLRTPNAGDVDIAAFVSESQFNQLCDDMINGIISRTGGNPTLQKSLLDTIAKQRADGRINSFYFNRVNGVNGPSFNQELFELVDYTDMGRVWAAGKSPFDFSLMIGGREFDVSPYLKANG